MDLLMGRISTIVTTHTDELKTGFTQDPLLVICVLIALLGNR